LGDDGREDGDTGAALFLTAAFVTADNHRSVSFVFPMIRNCQSSGDSSTLIFIYFRGW
jgi:hypothetical protein